MKSVGHDLYDKLRAVETGLAPWDELTEEVRQLWNQAANETFEFMYQKANAK